MKKLTFLIAFALVIFYGCNKQETNPAADNQQVNVSNVTIHSINFDGEPIGSTVFTLEEVNNNTGSTSTLKANNNQHANGHFHTQLGSVISFSIMVNNGGVHGSVNMQLYGGQVLKLNSTGLAIEGNQGAGGGQITHTSGFPEGHPFATIGNYVYFLGEDNGEGNNAPSDRYSEQIYWSPEEYGDLTFLLAPSSGAWDPAFIFDTAEDSDQIQVND